MAARHIRLSLDATDRAHVADIQSLLGHRTARPAVLEAIHTYAALHRECRALATENVKLTSDLAEMTRQRDVLRRDWYAALGLD